MSLVATEKYPQLTDGGTKKSLPHPQGFLFLPLPLHHDKRKLIRCCLLSVTQTLGLNRASGFNRISPEVDSSRPSVHILTTALVVGPFQTVPSYLT